MQTERKSSSPQDVTLLLIAGKILAKNLLNRPNAHFDQAGHIPKRNCVGSGKTKEQ